MGDIAGPVHPPHPGFRRFLSAAALTLIASFAGDALADDKRPTQDYGRPPEPTTVGDVLDWPARAALFPLFLVNEFVFRRPLGFLVVQTEKHRVIETVTDVFTFGPRRQVTIMPSVLFDFGLLPSVGFNLAWQHFIAEENTFKFHFGTWGIDWLALKATSDYRMSKTESVGFVAEFVRRRDNPFFGLGPRSSQDDWTRYGSQGISIYPKYEREFFHSSSFEAAAGVKGLHFFDGGCCSDPELGDYIAQGRLPTPTGFNRDYYGGFQKLRLTIDSRRPRPEPGSGLRADLHEETMYDAGRRTNQPARSWVKWGGALGAAWDITGTQRVLGLTVDTEFVDPIQGQVPFTEQVSLGGKGGIMPGYVRNRLIDRSAIVATIQYTWPVWVFLDGVIQLAAGNVWGEHLNNFDLKAQRVSGSIGVRSNGDRDSGFELTIGAGTDPLDQGFGVSSFRFLIGSHHGL